MIYLDNASTTKPDYRVLDIYQQVQSEAYFNSESLHTGGIHTKKLLSECRKYIQNYFNTNKEVLFARSGSHANAIAIYNYLQNTDKKVILVSPYEHPSVLAALSTFKQFTIQYMPLDSRGEIAIDQIHLHINAQTALIIMQHVNSETGYILPVKDIAKIAKLYNIPIHVDGVQAVKKIETIDLTDITSYSFSGHKFHATKGSGTVIMQHQYIKPLNPHYLHEQHSQNGTIDTASIIAMTKALSLPDETHNITHVKSRAERLAKLLNFNLINYENQSPYILGLLSPKYEGQYIMQTLASKNVCISTGTACGHGMLLSDGLQGKINTLANDAVDQYIRLSFSQHTSIHEIDQCFDHLATMY
ncbi:aminotransferase class V-fold PLP-dependent enzyme [Staphylococcus gallinarum]|uniref:Aminotransferase class V-fold PLP-dependent enzyme n=1 Tax=Staphylococcus gallinarum TaxID=1293 RepID=A0A3A0VNP4_STAGA|nr:aminotransferase class V-fold PLP-dependent enzyme [Staphylococcus gallinarum]RIP35025.1 aminotransferase class V-fold PLP-dependent enzyme [Staphylococcus gallinarum]